jgi:hypothetical protein
MGVVSIDDRWEWTMPNHKLTRWTIVDDFGRELLSVPAVRRTIDNFGTEVIASPSLDDETDVTPDCSWSSLKFPDLDTPYWLPWLAEAEAVVCEVSDV